MKVRVRVFPVNYAVNNSVPHNTRSEIISSFSDGTKRPKVSISTLRPYHHNSTHQPGGNMVILRSLLLRKQKDKGDKQRMGRWVVLTMGISNKEVAGSGKVSISRGKYYFKKEGV